MIVPFTMRINSVCLLGWTIFHQLLLARAQTPPDNPLTETQQPTPPDNPLPAKEIYLVSPPFSVQVIALRQKMLSPPVLA